MKSHFTFLLLLISLCSFPQEVVKVFSGDGYLQNLQSYGNYVFVTARTNGFIKLNKEDLTFISYNGSNSPLKSQSPYQYQVYNSDTFLIFCGEDWWLNTSGFWQNLASWNRQICITNDGRIFRDDSIGNPGLEEFINDHWQLATDAFIQGRSGFRFKSNYNNDLYIIYGSNLVKYSNGTWSNVPGISDSINNIASPFPIVFDNHSNVYFSAQDSNPTRHLYYQLVNNNWVLLPMVTYNGSAVVSYFRDTAENLYYLIDSSDQNYVQRWAWLKTIKGGVTYSYDLTAIASSDYGIDGITGTDTNDIYLTTATRLHHGSLATGFNEIKLSNCIALTDEIQYPVALECGHKFYFFGGLIDVIDTAGNCTVADSVSSFNLNISSYQGPPVLLRDNKGQLWEPVNSSQSLKNLITENVENVLTQLDTGIIMGMRDSASYWYYSNTGTLSFVTNNSTGTSYNLPSTDIMHYFTDSAGNLWFDCRDNYSAVVYRMNKQGVLQQFTYAPSTSADNYYQFFVTVDDKGDAWVRQHDSLVRYRGENADAFVMNMPHDYMQLLYHFKVFDSSEIVIDDWENVFYYHNGTWKTAVSKTQSSGWAEICSDHNSKVTFFTNGDGIVVYDFDAPAFLNGNRLQGTMFEDTNGNHYQDAFENGLPYQSVTINGDIYSTNSIGQYSTDVLVGNFTIKPNAPPYFIAYPDSYSVQATPNFQRFDTLNFACSAPRQVNDLGISLTPGIFPYGYIGQLTYTVSNYGTVATNATLQLRYDSSVALQFSSVSPSDTSPGLVTIPLGFIYPHQQINEYLWFNIIPQFVYTDSIRDTVVHFYATILPVAGDTTPANNYDSLGTAIVWSFDPNYKSVTPGGFGIYNTIDTNQLLTYAIHFQNTGTAPAVNITVKDTLDDKLDVSTFKYLGSSHPNSYHITGHILTLQFSNINLPDSTVSYMNSQGYFKYSIKPKRGAEYGQQINNAASIYFDFNSPVETNNTTVTFGPVIYNSDAGAPNSNTSSPVTIFPNPVGDNLNYLLRKDFELPGIVTLLDNTGRLVLTQRATSLLGQISVNKLSNSSYIFKIVNSNGKTTRLKFVKMK